MRCQVEDHAGSLPDHPASRRPGGDEVRLQPGDDSTKEIFRRHVDQRRALGVSS
jgi:hypothetical protein